MPDTDPTLPLTCQLDRKRLGTIEAKLDLTLSELKTLVSIDGPIGKLQQELILNRQMTEAAHKRLDDHGITLEKLGGRQWDLVVKVAGAVLGGGGLLMIVVRFVEGFAAR